MTSLHHTIGFVEDEKRKRAEFGQVLVAALHCVPHPPRRGDDDCRFPIQKSFLLFLRHPTNDRTYVNFRVHRDCAHHGADLER